MILILSVFQLDSLSSAVYETHNIGIHALRISIQLSVSMLVQLINPSASWPTLYIGE